MTYQNRGREEKKETQFNRREWLLVIAVLLMGEYWLISISYDSVDNERLTTFVSFAATIASLILAVLAIIYSFLQNDSSSKSTHAIIEQTKELKVTAIDLHEAAASITENLSRASDITKAMEDIEKDIKQSMDSVLNINNKLDEMGDNIKGFAKEKARKDAGETDNLSKMAAIDVARSLLSMTTYDLDIFAYSLKKYHENKDDLSVYEFVRKYYSFLSKFEGTGIDTMGAITLAPTVILFLKRLELLDFKSQLKSLAISDELYALLTDLVEQAKEAGVSRIMQSYALIEKIEKSTE